VDTKEAQLYCRSSTVCTLIFRVELHLI